MAKKNLISFLGDKSIKDAKIADLKQHEKLDNMIHNNYFNSKEKKGCAVTCTIFSPAEFSTGKVDTRNIHKRFETVLGIPRMLARLEDRIFEGLPVAESKKWPLSFIKAIPVGVDLSKVWRNFIVWLLIDDTCGVIKFAENEDSRKAIQNVAAAFERSLVTQVSGDEWDKLMQTARCSAAGAADAAADAADAAAYAADAAVAAASAAYAAYTAAIATDPDAVDVAAYNAADAVDDAVDAAAAAHYAAAVRTSARAQHFITMSKNIIELLKEAV